MIRDKPYLDQIILYIKKNLKKGYTKDSLRFALINQGYSRMEVDKALNLVEKELAEEAPILKAKPEIEHEIIIPEETKPKKKSFWKKITGK